MVVARREAAMSWRTQKRVDAALEGLQTQFEEMSDGDQSPVEGMLKAETIEKLKQAASELPADQREVLRRRFSDGLSFREIAQELDIPLGTALTRLHTALKRLRKLLNES
jgi:RNA polymerase sigma-70 factor, ECF subfamily